MCMDPVDLEGRVSLVSSIPSGSDTLSASSSMGFLIPDGKDLMETYHFGAGCFKCSLFLEETKH